ncbi:MAG: hypothetical protein E6G46_03185 [Actinobacteria bacterium]|nr:MAG: hypothetical protein E6G46_03185 [Actinomycetota bacterium]
MPSFRTLRRLALAVWAACALFIYPAAHARAGLLPVPLPSVSLPALPLPTSSPALLPSVPIVGDLLSPTPTVTGVPGVPLPGQLNDTVGGITGLLGLGGKTGTPSQGPTTGGTSSGSPKGTTGRSSGTSTTSNTNRSHVGTSGLTVLDGIGVITPGESFDAPYASITGQAAKKAAGRALDLAGPLAPPLLLACIALGVLMMLSRGSTRLVKLDVVGLARRTWQI